MNMIRGNSWVFAYAKPKCYTMQIHRRVWCCSGMQQNLPNVLATLSGAMNLHCVLHCAFWESKVVALQYAYGLECHICVCMGYVVFSTM